MANIVYLTNNSGAAKKNCILVKWNRQIGSPVIVGQSLFTYRRDELTISMTSPWSGVVLKRYYNEGDSILENMPVCIIGKKDEDISLLDQAIRQQKASGIQSAKGEGKLSESGTMSEPIKEIKDAEAMLKDINERMEKFDMTIKSIGQLDCKVTRDAPFVISFAGRFKTGKSSLMNALIGFDLLPTKATTATSIVTRIFKGDSLCAWVRRDGQNIPVSIEAAKNVILSYKPNPSQMIDEVIFEVPIPWLPDYVELRDTPGTSDTLILEQMAASALIDTDLCICIYDAGALFSEAEREATLRLHKQLGGNLVYAVNRTNLLNSLERLREVENHAKSFFGTMDYPQKGMGKYYVMCSAPGMIELDGFDIWFKDLVSNKNIGLLNRLRHVAVQGRVKEMKEDIKASAHECAARVKKMNDAIGKKHDQLLREKRRAIQKKAEAEAMAIRENIANMEKALTATDGLQEKLEALITSDSWKDSYVGKSKEVTRSFFQGQFNNLYRNNTNAKSIDGVRMIDNAFSTLTFPAPKFTTKKATGGEVAGGAGIGALIGSLFAPGIGTAIGAAIGAAIGGSDNGTSNESVQNTMAYVHNTVIPALRRSFQWTATNAAQRKQQYAVNEAKSVTSGLEKTISQIETTAEALQRFCIL